MPSLEERVGELEAKINALRQYTPPRFWRPEMVSQETPTDSQVYAWNDTNKMWRPDSKMKTQVMIHTGSACSLGPALAAIAAAAPTSDTVAQNQAYYVPFTLDETVTVAKLFVVNGATAAGNLDVGIYNESYALQVSIGSTAQSGTNAVQAFDITDTSLSPGRYYLAVASNSLTATLFFSAFTNAAIAEASGMAQEAAAFPLPATATPVVRSGAGAPLIGLSLRTLV